MYIKELELHNFGPFFGTHKKEFSDKSSIIFVEGQYQGCPERSNKAGKSTFIESIPYLLYGKFRKGIREVDFIHYGQDLMYVKGAIIIDGKKIEVKRGRTSKNKPILEITGLEGKTKDLQKELEEQIGLSYDDFTATFFFPQNRIHSIMEATPAEKQAMFQQWFNLGKWDKYFEKSKAKYEYFKQKVSSLENLLQDRKNTLNSIQITKTVKEFDELITKINLDIEYQNNAKKELEEKIKSFDDAINNQKLVELNNKFRESEQNIQKIVSNLSSNEAVLKQYMQNKIEYEQLSKEVFDENSLLTTINGYKAQSSDLVVKMTEIRTNLQNLQSLQSNMSSFTGTCPVDLQPCDKGNRIPDFKANLENDITTALNQYQQLEQTYQSVNSVLKELSNNLEENSKRKYRLASIENQTDTTSISNNIDSLKQTLSLLESEHASTKAAILETQNKLQQSSQVKELKQQFSQVFTKISSLESDLQYQYNAKATLIHNIKQKENIQNEIIQFEQELVVFRKQMYELSYITFIFSKYGIPSLLIENSMRYIEGIANDILSQILPTTKLEFSSIREVSTKETNCKICGSAFGKEKKCSVCGFGVKGKKVKEEISIKVLENGKEASFASDSGGGKLLISLSLRLALSKLLSNNTKCEMLILDEVFGALDEVNRNALSNVLFNIVPSLLGFRQTFVITHTPLGNYNYDKITIMRDGNISKILV